MRIYTRSGDKGTTSLVYGKRVKKDDTRVEAYGTCDEANSMIGFALSQLLEIDFKEKEAIMKIFHKIQTALFHVGAELSTPKEKDVKWKVAQEWVDELEKIIDEWDAELDPLRQFILPGGHPAASALHVARTIVRRAERVAVKLDDEVNPLALSYLNRLSDFLFVSGRYVNHILGIKESVLHEES
ncbi:cob(I)yrinic acid a,c-diamide adenosyltransferase [Pullulanibacillus sp. KACC 23026]|uniref:cob(I)yrinic acid a,c-diamide adenosyltransferase n=1 Tax=Pullulanibacillus sp. KACC 23026 TaxID=3028315 RepID=UPI0023AF4FC2|nr:cob(I)yrinic acid a,c-diamide adenosyltransferase [Pullulanibacillus sp. KACC 23026]WEG12263.1 cob(I)yrinic acid a,c-diamide adenosyltransferase [Pullulanibacillus sp. KACC 23026]